MKQLIAMKQEYEKRGFHLQRLYCRRAVNENGQYVTTFNSIMEVE
jgi:hypothetical protein